MLNGDIQSAQRFADYNATLNNLYGFKNAVQYMWLGPSQGQPRNGFGAWSLDQSLAVPYWQATTAGSGVLLYFSVPLFGTSATVRAKITAIDAHVLQAGAAGITLNVRRISGMSSAATPTQTLVGTSSGPASTGEKIITVGSLTTGMDNDSYLLAEISPPTNNDIVYGVRVTYDLSLYV